MRRIASGVYFSWFYIYDEEFGILFLSGRGAKDAFYVGVSSITTSRKQSAKGVTTFALVINNKNN